MAGVRQFDEAEVMKAVLATFWFKGWQATSMADLAEAAHVQRGSLYHAYGSKESLFLLAYDAYADRFLTNARRALRAPTAAEAVAAFFAAAIDNMTAGVPANGCLTTKTAVDAEAMTPRILARMQQMLDDIRALLVEGLSEPGVRAGLALEPSAAAELLLTFTRGLAVMERIEHDPDRLRVVAASLTALVAPAPATHG